MAALVTPHYETETGETTKRPLISACIPMRNEAKQIAEWVASVRKVTDSILVLDTGSTDKTVELLEAEGVPVVRSARFTPETDPADFSFAAARNEALSHCPGEWALGMDADERITKCDGFLEELRQYPIAVDDVLVRLVYPAHEQLAERVYRRTARFVGEMHNAVHFTDRRTTRKLELVHGARTNEKARSDQRLAMAKRYFGGLVQSNPYDSRAWFYLAQTHMEARKWEEAIRYWQEYFKITTWRDEAYQSAMGLAYCYLAINRPEMAEDTMSRYLRCNPSRAEAFIILGRIAYAQKRYQDAVRLFRHATACTDPETMFFLERRAYSHEPWDRLAMALFQCRQNEKALEATEKALSFPDLPPDDRKRLEHNRDLFTTAAPPIQRRPDEDKRDWREADRLAIQRYREGDKRGAAAATMQALAGKPPPEDARRLRDNLIWYDEGLFYDVMWQGRPNPTDRERKRLQRMAALLGEPKRVIDIGAGPGWLKDYLPKGTEYVGIDISPRARQAIEDKGGKAFENLQVANWTVPDGYDGAVLGEVLEHLADDAGMLRQVAAAMAKDAVLVISVPQHKAMTDPAHRRDYTKAEITALASQVGTVELTEDLKPWTILKVRIQKEPKHD